MTLGSPPTETGNELRDRCSTCNKQFGKKSSLLRHMKICVGPQNRSRQKSCGWCSATKSKCDLKMPSCSRCVSRNSLCEYVVKHAPVNNFGPVVDHSPSTTSQTHMDTIFLDSPRNSQEYDTNTHRVGTAIVDPFATPSPISSGTSLSEHTSGDVSFASMVAHFSEGTEDDHHPPSLSEAWKQSIIPISQPLSILGKHSMRFSFRILRTWPLMMSKQNPPIFHQTQTRKDNMASALANCHTIAKMWEGQQANPSDFLRETTIREMTRLFQNYLKFDETELLASIQAICIYLILVLFPGKDQPSSVFIIDMAILSNVQQLVNYIGSVGLVLKEEKEHRRPTWDDWIVITTRRRTIFTLYLIHWIISAYYGLPTFDCQELRDMLAPAPKLLWLAENKDDWESNYNRWLVGWEGHEYLHGEISQIEESLVLDTRSERWLGEADDLGLLVMALGEMVNMERDMD